jgi:hypothetical protein
VSLPRSHSTSIKRRSNPVRGGLWPPFGPDDGEPVYCAAGVPFMKPPYFRTIEGNNFP